MHCRSYRRMVGPLALVILSAGACGTRVTPDPAALAPSSPVTAPLAGSAGGLVDRDAAVPEGPAGRGPAAVASGAGRENVNERVSGKPDGSAATLPTRASGGPVETGADRQSSPGRSGSTGSAPVLPSPGTPEAPGSGTAPSSGSKSPITIGTVGTLSGPAGVVFLPVAQGLQVWVRDANSRGGVNGHEVKLNVYDAAGDPARHRALVQKAVETDGVKAFLANTETFTGSCCIDYINAKRVPIVGSDTASPWFYKNAMYFPQASSGDDMAYGAIASVAQQMIPQGKNKVGAMTCVEASICKDAQRVWSESAKKLGLEVVYQTQVSISQPDFTAECLAARNAGAQIVLMGFDSNTVQRVVSSCVRQSYHPTWATTSVAITTAYKDDPNFDGMVAGSQGFPWFQTGTPATDQYQAAIKRFGAKIAPSAAPALGWLAGKVFERAAANLPEPATSAALLEGLWSIQNDDMDGLTLPLTYQREKPSPQRSCWFNILLKGGAWRSPNAFKLNCS